MLYHLSSRAATPGSTLPSLRIFCSICSIGNPPLKIKGRTAAGRPMPACLDSPKRLRVKKGTLPPSLPIVVTWAGVTVETFGPLSETISVHLKFGFIVIQNTPNVNPICANSCFSSEMHKEDCPVCSFSVKSSPVCQSEKAACPPPCGGWPSGARSGGVPQDGCCLVEVCTTLP